LEKAYFYNSIRDQINQVELLMRAQAKGHHSDLGAALNHLLTSGGKRIRPAVALLSGKMLGADTGRLVTLAAALEMLHTATLVHDDLIDGSLLRRGNPTLNAQWSPAATVLTGDFIFAQAARLAAETGSVDVMKLFAKTLATIVSGEINQLFGNRGLVSREDYFQRIYAKTASLFELATGAAVLLSPAGKQYEQAVCLYGYEIGIAFQIVDDILDFTGDQEMVGKPVASDLRQGLVTLPVLKYLAIHPEDQSLIDILNGNRFNEELILNIVAAIRQSGAIEQSLEEARQFATRGVEALENAPAGVERSALEDLANYIVEREI
jgi:geranylgeranyl pyrophosphate synthase